MNAVMINALTIDALNSVFPYEIKPTSDSYAKLSMNESEIVLHQRMDELVVYSSVNSLPLCFQL